MPLSASRAARWAPVALFTLLLLPAAFFPLGGDAALYLASGGKIIHQGAAHYRDIVDVKPPLIYHLYALSSLAGTAGFRVVDLLLQIATASALFGLVAKHVGRNEGIVAGALYAITYVAQSYNGTAITESYVGLAAIPMVALQLRRRDARDFILVGILAGALFLLKFSLATPLAAAALCELLLFDDALARRLRNIALMSAGFIATAALLPLYLSIVDAWKGFAEMNHFLAGYVRNQSPGVASTIMEGLTALPTYFADDYSMAMLAASIVGCLAVARRLAREGDRSAGLPGAIALVNIALMLVAVAIEAKYRAFHLSRILPFAAVIAASGVIWTLRRLRSLRPLDRYSLTLVIGLLPVALLFSPISRYVRHTAGAALWTLQGPEGFDRAYYFDGLGYSYQGIDSIARRATHREERGADDEMFVSSSVAGLVYAFAERLPPTRVYHSAFLIAPYAPDIWRSETARYLVTRQPRYIVAHLRDSMEEMTGSPLSSDEMLRALPGVDSLLHAAYDTALVTRHFELYERRRR